MPKAPCSSFYKVIRSVLSSCCRSQISFLERSTFGGRKQEKGSVGILPIKGVAPYGPEVRGLLWVKKHNILLAGAPMECLFRLFFPTQEYLPVQLSVCCFSIGEWLNYFLCPLGSIHGSGWENLLQLTPVKGKCLQLVGRLFGFVENSTFSFQPL